MDKLPEVEIAKALMTEAMSWSVMKWLREKKSVRKTADKANAALDRLNEAVKNGWSDYLKAAYEALSQPSMDSRGADWRKKSSDGDAEIALTVKKVKEADDEAFRARVDAEATFDEAERQLSTSLAREGCRKAIHGWELHEKAIRKAESAVR